MTVCKHTVSSSISLPSSGFFSPFPHGTSPLSVSKEYLALESGLPRFKQGFTCPVLLRIPAQFIGFRIRDFHPLWSAFPNSSSNQIPLMQVLQPQSARTLVWAPLRSLAATGRISIDFFSGRYLDVSVPYVSSSSTTLLIEGSGRFLCQGLPHSEISGSKLDYQLTEAYRRLTASFIASYCQGIHRVPLIALS